MSAHRARRASVLVVLVLSTFAVAAPARADSVTAWNEIATDALIRDGGQGAIAIANLAMVHGAVYDAVNAIDGRLRALPRGAGGGALVLAGRGRGDRRISRARRQPAAGRARRAAAGARRPAEAAVRRRPRDDPARRGEGRGDRDRQRRRGRHDRGADRRRPLRALPVHGRIRRRSVASRGARLHQRSGRMAQGRQAVPDRGCLAVPVAAARTRSRAPGTPRSSTRSRRSALPTARRAPPIRRRRRSSGAWRTRPARGATSSAGSRSPATARSPTTRGCSRCST